MTEPSRPAPPQSAPRLAFIDGLRALAALWVVLGHTWFEPSNGNYRLSLLNHLGLSYASLAVAVFIVISGFCLTLPVARRGGIGSVPEFFRRRTRRILPPYYACLALSSLFILTLAHRPTGTVWDICLPLNFSAVWRHVLLVHNFVPPLDREALNYPLWSIAVEAQLYLLFPLIALLLKTRGAKMTAVMLTLLGLGATLACWSFFRESRFWFVGCFGLGAAAAWKAVRGETALFWGKGGIALGAAVGAAVIAGGKARFLAFSPLFDLALGGAAALVLGALYADREGKSTLNRLLSCPPLEKCGLFSYSLYLVHAPLLHLHYLGLNRLFHPAPETMFLLLLATLPLILAEAYLFFLAFERPFLHAKPEIE